MAKRKATSLKTYDDPLVTVVIPVHNGERYLAEAIQSILDQDFDRWRLLVVDDCSTDASGEIPLRFNDERIQVIRLDRQMGVAIAANIGIAESDTEFIARLDSDDISEPNRLSVQLEFFRKNPDVALIGTWAEFFGDRSVLVKPPTTHNQLKAELLWRNPFIHSSTMFRRAILEKEPGPYAADFAFGEDYDLWQRVSLNFRVGTVPEILTKHRIHQSQLTKNREPKSRQQRLRREIAFRHRAALGYKTGLGAIPPFFLLANLGILFPARGQDESFRRSILGAFFRWVRGRFGFQS